MPPNNTVETIEYQSPPPSSNLPPVFASRRVVSFVIASVVLFVASLTQPAMHLDGSKTGKQWECLLLLFIGWIGVFDRIYAWLANPTLVVGWMFLLVRWNRCAAATLIFSLGLALSFLRETRWKRDESGSNTSAITGHGVGYWLWVASIAIALAGSLFAVVFERVERRDAVSQ